MSRSLRFKLGFFALVGVVVILGVIFAASNVFRANTSIPADRMAAVERADLALAVVATGSIAPVTQVEIKSKASGLVKSILVEEGDRVKAGRILVELDKELLQAQLREADANRLASAARLQEAEAEVTSTMKLKEKLHSDLRNLENKVTFVERQAERSRNMFEEKLIARSDLERAEREVQDVLLQVESLGSEILMQESRIEGARKVVARTRAEVVQAEAALDRARENLRYATISSPIDGTVLKRHVEVGDAVSSILQLGSQATLVLTLGDMSEVFVEGRVDENDIGKVFVGQAARVKVDAFRDRTFPGTVTRMAPLGEKIDNIVGFQVRVSIEDREKILRSQMSANAEIIIEEKRNILVIPESAIIYDRQRRTFAEVYDPNAENQRRRVPLQPGISNGTLTEVVAGLKEGEQVVLQ